MTAVPVPTGLRKIFALDAVVEIVRSLDEGEDILALPIVNELLVLAMLGCAAVVRVPAKFPTLVILLVCISRALPALITPVPPGVIVMLVFPTLVIEPFKETPKQGPIVLTFVIFWKLASRAFVSCTTPVGERIRLPLVVETVLFRIFIIPETVNEFTLRDVILVEMKLDCR